jgi:uncharacterized membrane protein YfcA
MKESHIAVVIGLVAGVAGGLFGIGGGVLIVPALIFALGFSQLRAQGTSLVALLAPVGLLALLEYHRKGETDLKAGALIALGFFIGGMGGAKLSLGLGELAMRRGFAIFLIVIAVWLFLKK